ncbi:MAG: hypothetical protein V4719_30410, partial [Planctomycetota bacterium]
MSQLTDQELIQLVQEKLPEELTETELDQLRERLRVSAELRDTLLEQLHFEAYLNEALGKFEVSIDEIVAVGPQSRNRLSGYWGWTIALLAGFFLCSILVVVVLPRAKPKAKPELAAEAAVKKAEKDSAFAKQQADGEKVIASTKAVKSEPHPPETIAAAPAKPNDPVAAKPAPVSPKETIAADAPWAQLVNSETPPQAAVEASYQPQGDQWGLRRERLQQWLEPVPNLPHQFHESQHGELPLASFDGLLKLRAPWPADAVLRLSPY